MYVSADCKLRVDVESRAITTESLRLRLKRWTFVSLTSLPVKLNSKCVVNNEFVLIGCLALKSIKTSKINTKYLLIKLDDFNASISCFIFNADVIEKFYKIQIGTILVLAAPKIQNNSNSNNISLKIDDFEQILIVGKSMDFAFCPKIDGSVRCQDVINKAKSDLCTFHKAQSYKKYAAKRNDTNRSSLSRLRQNGKRSLSGNMRFKSGMNGISMMQTNKKYKQKPAQSINYRVAQRQTTNRLLTSSAMTASFKHRLVGNKHQQKERNKQINKLLIGKSLMPHLGTKWNAENSMSESQRKALRIINKKGIVFKEINPNDTTNIIGKKRSFQNMMNGDGRLKDGGLQRKKSKNRLNVKHLDMDKVIKQKSSNDKLLKDMERANVLQSLDDLEDEEKLFEDLNEVTSVSVTIYICKNQMCSLRNKLSEKVNSFCLNHQRDIVKVFGKKYFWKCSSCGCKEQFSLHIVVCVILVCLE